MAWDLKGNLEDEIARARSIGVVGSERASQLFPPYPFDDHPPIVDQGAVVDEVFEQDATAPGTRLPQRPPLGPKVQEALAGIDRVVGEVPALLGNGDGIGSNGWVVGGEHTVSGAPILANDPHLGISLPGVWVQVGLHCREVSEDCPLDVAGFSFSGVPGVIIGHNADIAWGFTNLAPDTTDLYVERVRDDRWQHDGRSRPLKVREETIEVRDGDDVVIQVRSTAHGPLLSDLDGELGDELDEAEESGVVPDDDVRWDHAVSLAWTALEPRPTADALYALNLATDWRSFHAALADFAVPGQNVVYADTEGHIGYQATGEVPIRKSGNDGLLPAAGWLAENDWTGEYVPYEALPNVLDPDSGLVVTANQAVVDDASGYPYFLTDDWDRGYRSARIRDLLVDEGPLDADDMASVQNDDRNPMAPVLTPYLLAIDLPGGYYSDGQRLLTDWDFHQDADSAAAAYYNVVWRELLARTFHDELTGTLRPDGGQRWFAVVADLLTRPGDLWWDDLETEDVVETRDDILEESRARGPRRPHGAAVAERGRVDLGWPAPAGAAVVDPRGVRDRCHRAAVQPRRLGGRRRWLHPQRDRLGRAGGLRRRVGALDADGHPARRPRRCPVDQPDRSLRPCLPRPLRRPDRPVGARGDPAVGVLGRCRRGCRGGHADTGPRRLRSLAGGFEARPRTASHLNQRRHRWSRRLRSNRHET